MVSFVPPKSAELVVRHIRRRIVRGELQEGDALPAEMALMQEFGLSRPTLREALRVLESEGLITVRRGAKGGARVQVPKGHVAARYAGLVLQHRGASLADVYEARRFVEAPAARMLTELKQPERMKAAEQLQAEIDANRKELLNPAMTTSFHRLVVELAGNETLMLFTEMLEFIAESAGKAYVAIDSHLSAERNAKAAIRSHEKLIELIKGGDSRATETFWRQHLAERGKALLRVGDITLDVLG